MKATAIITAIHERALAGRGGNGSVDLRFLRIVAAGRFRLNSIGIAGEGGKEAPPESARRARVSNGDGEGEARASNCDGEGKAESTVDGSSFNMRRASGTRELSGTRVPGKRMVCHTGSSMASGVAIKTPMAFNVTPAKAACPANIKFWPLLLYG